MSSSSPKQVNRKLVIIGCGTVGTAFLGLLGREFSFESVTVLARELKPSNFVVPSWAKFVQIELTPENYDQVLSSYLSAGNICLNVAVLGCMDVVVWCQEHDVLYLDTSGEDWDEEDNLEPKDRATIDGLSLYSIQTKLAKRLKRMKEDNPDKTEWPTAVLYHGMNPGMVNQCMKQGLLDIANAVLDLPDARNREAIEAALAQRNFAELAYALGVKAMHIAERDTQVSSRPRYPGEFASTWSVEGFVVELKMYSEFALGTHEQTIPHNSIVNDEGEDILLGTKGANTRIYSWVPSGPTLGFLTPHDETLTMGKYLTVRDEHGNLKYRPTILFSYLPCDLSVCSIHEYVMSGYGEMKEVFLDGNKIVGGKDEVGILFLGHQLGSWWTGSTMSIEDARKIIPGHGPTTIQVCSGVISGLHWLLDNPMKGVCKPEDMDHEYVLEKARPYLEPFVSIKGDFDPLKRSMLHHFDYESTFGPITDDVHHSWIPQENQKWQLPVLLQGAKTLVPSPCYVPDDLAKYDVKQSSSGPTLNEEKKSEW